MNKFQSNQHEDKMLLDLKDVKVLQEPQEYQELLVHLKDLCRKDLIILLNIFKDYKDFRNLKFHLQKEI